MIISFPALSKDTALSNMAMLKLLERMGRKDLTVHGFRSTFRDWAAERTNFPREVAEMALAHAVSDKVEAAYRRGDMFERRRRLLAAWAAFCAAADQPASRGAVSSLISAASALHLTQAIQQIFATDPSRCGHGLGSNRGPATSVICT